MKYYLLFTTGVYTGLWMRRNDPNRRRVNYLVKNTKKVRNAATDSLIRTLFNKELPKKSPEGYSNVKSFVTKNFDFLTKTYLINGLYQQLTRGAEGIDEAGGVLGEGVEYDDRKDDDDGGFEN